SFREVRYEPAEPPATLLHGTGSNAAVAIREQGLKPMSRTYVHLTPDEDVAGVVGRRHAGKLIMLSVRALEAHRSGILFHNPAPLIWLAKEVPPEFIDFPR
ncbi:MAG: RNA 2'-phosphotransferase, partial [Planctomycetota bacterium]